MYVVTTQLTQNGLKNDVFLLHDAIYYAYEKTYGILDIFFEKNPKVESIFFNFKSKAFFFFSLSTPQN